MRSPHGSRMIGQPLGDLRGGVSLTIDHKMAARIDLDGFRGQGTSVVEQNDIRFGQRPTEEEKQDKEQAHLNSGLGTG